MSLFRRVAALVVVVGLASAVGCGSSSPPPAPEAPSAANTAPLDGGNGSLIRTSKEPAPPPPSEPPPAPKPGEIVLPASGGTWPWNLAAAPQVEPSRPITIPGYMYPESTTSGVVVSPAARRAIVLIGERVKDEEKMTRVVLCDLATGAIRSEWKVKGIYAPLDLHADGRRLLATRPQGEGRTDLLELWAFDEPDRLRRQSWQPHDSLSVVPDGDVLVTGAAPDSNQPDPGRDIRWAAFTGGRIVSASRGGQLRVFDAETLQRVGSIDAVAATPTLTPDGTRVVFLTRHGAVLLDPIGAKVIGVRSVGQPPAEPALGVSPDGKTLICAGNGRANVLDLTTGAARTTAIPKLEVIRLGQRLAFGWAGDRHLLADRFLYDPDRSEPVWDYGHIDRVLPRGRETWVVIRPGRDAATLRSFVLPHPAVGAGGKSGRSTIHATGIADASER
jgi:hypothetical protein